MDLVYTLCVPKCNSPKFRLWKMLSSDVKDEASTHYLRLNLLHPNLSDYATRELV